MRFYHFTAAHLIDSIIKTGINRGQMARTIAKRKSDGLPIVGVQFGWQWLTINPDFEAQTWQDAGHLPYRRNAFRLTIEIPDRFADNVYHWITYSKTYDDPIFDDVNRFGNPENWFLFKGDIDPKWIVHVETNPNALVDNGPAKKSRPLVERLFRRKIDKKSN